MIHNIGIQNADVFKAVERETSQNFRALRASATPQGDAIDATFEDMVVTEDDYSALLEQMEVVIPSIYQDIRAYSPEYFVSDDAFGYAIEAEDCNSGQRLTPLFEKVAQYMLLSWWYKLRAPQLAEQYAVSASDIMSAIRSIVIPKFGTRKLRYF